MPIGTTKQQALEIRRAKVIALVNEGGLTFNQTDTVLGLKSGAANDVKVLREQGHDVQPNGGMDYQKAVTFFLTEAHSVLTGKERERLDTLLRLQSTREEFATLANFAHQVQRPEMHNETRAGKFFACIYGAPSGSDLEFQIWDALMGDIENGQVGISNSYQLRMELQRRLAAGARKAIAFGEGEELVEYVLELLDEHLQPRAAKVIRMRFGLPPYTQHHSLEQVGLEFGVTRERIRQTEAKAMFRMRRLLCSPRRNRFGDGVDCSSVRTGRLLSEVEIKMAQAAGTFANHPTLGLIPTDDCPNVATVQTEDLSEADALLVWLATRTGDLRPVLRTDLDAEYAVRWKYVAAVMEAMCRSIDELELSVRSANCLQNAECKYVVQLVVKTEADLLKAKNFGRKSFNEIKEVLANLMDKLELPRENLTLGMRTDNPNVRAAWAHLGLLSVE